MSPELIAIITAAVAIIGFLWSLHRDVADLRERMVRLGRVVRGVHAPGVRAAVRVTVPARSQFHGERHEHRDLRHLTPPSRHSGKPSTIKSRRWRSGSC